MNQFDEAINATNTSLNSQGATMKQNEVFMQGIEAQTNLLKNAFQELVLGEGGLEKIISTVLGLTTSFLQFTNDTKLLNVALLATASIIAINVIPKMIALGISTAETTALFLMEVVQAKSLSAGLIALGSSVSVAKLAIGGLIAVVSIGALAINKYNSSVEESKRKTLELGESIKTLNSEHESIVSSINDENATRDSLIDTIVSLGGAYDEENDKLKTNAELRREALQLAEEERKQKAQELIDTSTSDYERALRELESGAVGMDTRGLGFGTMEEQLSNLQSIIRSGNISGVALQDLEDEFEDLSEKIEQNKAIVESYNSALEVLGMVYDQTTGKVREMNQAETDNLELQERLQSQNEDTIEVIEEEIEAIDDLEKAVNQLDSQLSSLSSIDLDGIADAFDLVSQAMEEMYTKEGMQIDTYNELMSLSAEYQMYLIDEEGNLRNTADAENALYSAKIDEMAITQARAMIDIASKMSEEGSSYAEATGDVQGYTNALWENVYAEIALKNITGEDATVLTNQINTLQDWATQAKKNIGTYKSMSRATSSATSASEDLTDALKDEIDQYERVFGYIEDRIDDYIDKIKERKDTELEAIDAQIEALKYQNDELESQISLEEALANIATAKSKKVKIYKAGQGFVYEEDSEAVSQAQSEYQTLLRKQQYEKQLKDLEDYKSSVEAQYDAQIKIYENYLDSFNSMVDAYETEQDRLLAEQLTGVNMENDMWIQRLTNFSAFVNKYNSLQKQLAKGVTNTTVNTTSGNSSTSTKTTTSSLGIIKPSQEQQKYTSRSIKLVGTKNKMTAYATGSDEIKSDQMGIVGDNPNKELVIGSNVDNGQVMNLKKGTRIINSEGTKAIGGILGMLGDSSLLNGRTSETSILNSSNSNSKVFNINSLVLNDVQNPQQFVDYFKGFETRMTQEAY